MFLFLSLMDRDRSVTLGEEVKVTVWTRQLSAPEAAAGEPHPRTPGDGPRPPGFMPGPIP